MKGLSIGATKVYNTEATITFLRECDITELRYTPRDVP
jgi:hypothetical protein